MKKSLLDTIVDPRELSVRFQPIFRISDGDNRIQSVEALIRGPRGSLFEAAPLLFDYARRKRAEIVVDHSCLAAICAEAVNLPLGLRINVNVHAVTLGQQSGFVEAFRRLAKRHALALDRFTVEIVEHEPSADIPELPRTLAGLRDSGVRIALDDVGLGQSNYRMMLECHPEYFKLDGYFVRGLKDDSTRRAVVESVVAFSNALQGAVVAEAAESMEDITLLAQMGVEFVQCNLLCPAIGLQELLDSGLLGPSPAVMVPARAVRRAIGDVGNFGRKPGRAFLIS